MARNLYLKSDDNQEVLYRYESISELKDELLKRNIEISPSSDIGSDVRLGNNISIGDRSRIRPDTVIGDNAKIGEDVFVGNKSKIGANTRLESNSFVNDRTELSEGVLVKEYAEIGKNSKIGLNTVIDVNALISDNNVIGAGSIIGPGSNIGEHATVGSNVNLGEKSFVAGFAFVYDNEIHKPNSLIQPPVKPVNLISNEQVEIFKNLNDLGVKYVAFGSFAINAFEQARSADSIKLWIDPSKENMDKLNEALKASGKDQISQPLDAEIKRPLKTDSGKSTSQTMAIDFYPSINGFKNEEFQNVYDRKNIYLAAEPRVVYASPDDQKNQPRINHLSPTDLFHNVGTTQSQSKEYSLNVLQKAMIDLNKQGQKHEIPDPLLYLEPNRTNMEPKKSYISFPGHEDKPKEFVPKFEKRDFAQLRKDLDLELVLNHYGYSLSDKSKPGDVFRVYKSGMEGDSQRLAVMNNPKGDYKMYVDLNNTDFRGDSIEFVKFKEGSYKQAFPVMDSILGNPIYKENVSQILPMKPATPGQFLNDEKLRQADILKNYNATHIGEKGAPYLITERALDVKTILAPEFKHQVLSVKRDKEFENTAFPLTSEKGNILSFDIRNKNYKALPAGGKWAGGKWDAIWKTNDHATLLTDSNFTVKDKVINLEKGTIGTLSKSAGKESFHINHPEHGQISLPIDKDKHQFQKIPANRIIISESPIDSLSYHQLSPPKAGEYRQYISTAGNPSKEQKIHVANLITANPQAQFVIGMDGNPPGNRFAINALAINHPQRDVNNSIVPKISYVNPSNPKAEDKSSKEVGYNILKIDINHPKEDGRENAKKSNDSIIDRLLVALNINSADDSKKAKESPDSRSIVEKASAFTSSYEIKFPNISKMVSSALDYLAKEINNKDGKPLIAVIRPSSIQNDFNDVLKDRKGVPLPESSNLSLSRVPLLSDSVSKREQIKDSGMSTSQSVSPKETSFKEPAIKSAESEVATPPKNKGFKL